MTTTERFLNDFSKTVPGVIASTDTTITLETGGGSRVHSVLTGSDEIRMTLDGTCSDSGRREIEIVICTGVSGDVLTVTRGAEGTRAQNYFAGCLCFFRATAGAEVASPGAVPKVFFSEVQLAIACHAASHMTLQGNYTLGNQYLVTKAGHSLAGFDFYWHVGTAKTIKCSIWDSGGTQLATVNVAVTAAGKYTATFATPVALSPFGRYYMGIWTNDASATGYCVARGDAVSTTSAISPLTSTPATNICDNAGIGENMLRIGGCYAAGDAWPSSGDVTFLAMIDPVCVAL